MGGMEWGRAGRVRSFPPSLHHLSPPVQLQLPPSCLQVEIYKLKWRDPRIRVSQCAGAVSHMISMSREDAKSDIARQVKS